MIKSIISDINVIIDAIYKKAYETTENPEDNEELKQFVASIRYYEMILIEIESKESFQDVFTVEDGLLKIKKDLTDVLTMLV
jgi:hypothetical protein